MPLYLSLCQIGNGRTQCRTSCEDLIPAFAISPMAMAESSAEYPKEPSTGAAYLKVSPIMLTLVLALELAAARISAKCPLSEADKPKAVRASVTMSEVDAKSSPEAAARFMMPSIPAEHIVGFPACHRHVVHSIRSLTCRELRFTAHFTSLFPESIHL